MNSSSKAAKAVSSRTRSNVILPPRASRLSLLLFAFLRIDSRTESAGLVARNGAENGRRKQRLRQRAVGANVTPGGAKRSWSFRRGNARASASSAASTKCVSVASHT